MSLNIIFPYHCIFHCNQLTCSSFNKDSFKYLAKKGTDANNKFNCIQFTVIRFVLCASWMQNEGFHNCFLLATGYKHVEYCGWHNVSQHFRTRWCRLIWHCIIPFIAMMDFSSIPIKNLLLNRLRDTRASCENCVHKWCFYHCCRSLNGISLLLQFYFSNHTFAMAFFLRSYNQRFRRSKELKPFSRQRFFPRVVARLLHYV